MKRKIKRMLSWLLFLFTFNCEIEEAKKIEQIEEMAKAIHEVKNLEWLEDTLAEALYNAGYRKQSEGEWIIDRTPIDATFNCSKCGYSYIEADPQAEAEYKFCPECSAKMKEKSNEKKN